MLGTGLLCTRPAVKKVCLHGVPCYKYAMKGPKEPYSALDPRGVLVERLGSDSPFSEVDLRNGIEDGSNKLADLTAYGFCGLGV